MSLQHDDRRCRDRRGAGSAGLRAAGAPAGGRAGRRFCLRRPAMPGGRARTSRRRRSVAPGWMRAPPGCIWPSTIHSCRWPRPRGIPSREAFRQARRMFIGEPQATAAEHAACEAAEPAWMRHRHGPPARAGCADLAAADRAVPARKPLGADHRILAGEPDRSGRAPYAEPRRFSPQPARRAESDCRAWLRAAAARCVGGAGRADPLRLPGDGASTGTGRASGSRRRRARSRPAR